MQIEVKYKNEFEEITFDLLDIDESWGLTKDDVIETETILCKDYTAVHAVTVENKKTGERYTRIYNGLEWSEKFGNYVATATAKEPKYFNKHEVEGYDRLVFNIEASKPNSNELSGLKILGFYDIVNCEYVDLSSYNITYPSWILHHPSSMDVLDDYGVPDLLEYNKLEESEVHDQIMKYLARVKIDSATTKKEIEAIMDEYRLELSNIIEARNALAQKINGTNELSDIKEKALEELDKYGYQKMEDIIND